MSRRQLLFLCLLGLPYALGFAGTLFQEVPTLQRTVPSKSDNVDVELPDFDELFLRMETVSPLLRNVLERKSGGLATVDDSTDLKWKRVETHKTGPIRSIDRIDNFQGHPAPLLKFRATLKGPCNGALMADMIMKLDKRRRWDDQIDEVYEIYSIEDLDYVNMAMGFGKYGDCSRLGVGYTRTKANLGVDAREQLTMCGLQDFQDGSCIIWGVELEEWHDFMFPPTERHTRAKSRVFCTTLQPTSDDSFDVEYVLQLEIGGKLPQFLTTPLVTNSVKRMFNHAEKVYLSDEVNEYMLKQ